MDGHHPAAGALYQRSKYFLHYNCRSSFGVKYRQEWGGISDVNDREAIANVLTSLWVGHL